MVGMLEASAKKGNIAVVACVEEELVTTESNMRELSIRDVVI